jgi:hypothetical protein
MKSPADRSRRVETRRPFATAIATLVILVATGSAGAEDLEGDPSPTPRLEILPNITNFESGASLGGRATALGEGSYRVQWCDANGKIDSRDLVGPGERAFTFELSYPRMRVNSLVLSRVKGRRADEVFRLAFKIALPAKRSGLLRIFVPGDADGPPPPDFPVDAILWKVTARPDHSSPPETHGRELVVDLALETLGGGPAPEVWGRQALKGTSPSRKTRVRVPCLNDPAYRAVVRGHVKKSLASSAAKLSAAVSLGTGLSATYRGAPYDFCTSQYCEAAFRVFLRKKYDGPATLARAWGLSVEGWGDATPRSLVELGFPHATRYSAWADHLAFRDATFAAFLDEVAKQVRALTSGAPVGFLGLGVPSAYGGADFELLGSVIDWRGSAWGPGSRRLAEDFGPRGGALGFVPGGSAADAARVVSGMLAGERLFFLRRSDEDAARALGVLPRGLGRIMEMSAPPPARPRGSELADAATPTIALVWSQSSVRASFVVDSQALGLPWSPGPQAPAQTLVPPGTLEGGRVGAWALAWEAWCSLLADLGVTFICVSEADVERGDLIAKGFRAAVLVRHMSVSADAALAIERFARSGGVVIADAGVGLFDGALARTDRGALGNLFGTEYGTVKFSEVGRKRVAVADRALRYVGLSDGPSFFSDPGPIGVGPAQSGLRLAGARAEGNFGDVPCLAVNAFGGGWGVTLNLAMTRYPRLRLTAGGGKALRSLVGDILTRAGVTEAVKMRYADGMVSPPSVRVRDAGSARLMTVRRDAHERRGAGIVKTRLTVAMDAPPAIHDPLRGVFVGWTRDVEVDLAPGEARVLALLPYRLRSIVAEPVGRPTDAMRPGPELFEVRLRRVGDGPWAPHVLDIRVEGPDGRPREELGRVLDVTGGCLEFVVPFASSDRPGLWTLRMRDALTGVSAIRRFVRRKGR